ncbi:hypothetical protein MWH25_12050 [Natroniella acetigena]|uniref:DUF6794 domain-containing protein n=1 Tax=Natroniella acetigena TaxID=52004 RepID=UPI00200A4426|nr:DUF6794 domain-containing protein [Natroniella acetigena]MCK8828460.1 hypothetical protein [Natroniella acetigena]
MHEISKEEIEEAVQYLSDEISDEILEKVKEMSEEELLDQHLFLGIQVRNMLREGGFKWNDVVLDELWREIIRLAVETSEI